MKRLGEHERAVMEVPWRSAAPVNGRQVAAALGDRGVAGTTVMTALDRLVGKGLAHREREPWTWRYAAVDPRKSDITELMLDALSLTGDRDAALARFVGSVGDTGARALRAALGSGGDADPGDGAMSGDGRR